MSAAAAARLDEIARLRIVDLAAIKAAVPQTAVEAAAWLSPRPPDFLAVLKAEKRGDRVGPALIAEIKRASPSRGDLAPKIDPLAQARLYRDNGAAAVSVLTEARHFKGSLDDLIMVHAGLPHLPLLRKDFIVDEYQVYEARATGAAAVLLIVACLAGDRLRQLHELAYALGMAALVEVHNAAELEIALGCAPRLVGINNRNLHDFSVSLDTSLRLCPRVPESVLVVAESGIHTAEDVRRLGAAGVDAVLVGEALVTAGDPAAKVRSLACLE